MPALSSDLFKKIRRIQFQTTQLAQDILAGAYRSAFKGRGMEFEEVREYQSGDEVRAIDWNVTARMGRPYIKNFREEREITVMLLVDVSSSSRFGSISETKRTITAEVGALIAFSAIKNNDKIGMILFSDSVEKYIPPKKGTRHVLHLIRELLAFEPKSRGTDIGKALSFLGNVQRRSGVCFLLSDFISPDYSHELALIAKRHDLISIGITDPHEIVLPAIDLVSLIDLESGEMVTADTSNTQLQQDFKSLAEQRLKQQEKLMKKVGAGFIDVRTDQPYIRPIRKFFKIRSKKRR
jgi:uncharacterized protein (DUF58 family)